MIPYEELCDALARWRSANGMTNGPSASPPRSAGAPARTSQPYAAQPPPSRTSQPYAAQPPAYAPPAFVPSVTQPDPPSPFGSPDTGEQTELHTAVPPGAGDASFDMPQQREDATGEIDIDAVDVVEEEEIT